MPQIPAQNIEQSDKMPQVPAQNQNGQGQGRGFGLAGLGAGGAPDHRKTLRDNIQCISKPSPMMGPRILLKMPSRPDVVWDFEEWGEKVRAYMVVNTV